jgi:hypothetical protein
VACSSTRVLYNSRISVLWVSSAPGRGACTLWWNLSAFPGPWRLCNSGCSVNRVLRQARLCTNVLWHKCSSVTNCIRLWQDVTNVSLVELYPRLINSLSPLVKQSFLCRNLPNILPDLSWIRPTGFHCLWFRNTNSFTGPPLWSSGQSSWIQIRRPGFDSRHYQKKKVVGLERGPVSPVSTTEELLDRKVAAPV